MARRLALILALILTPVIAHSGGPFVSVVKSAEAYTAVLNTENLRLADPLELGFFSIQPVRITHGSGAAFTVSPEGHMMTCLHVVHCSTQTIATWGNGASREAVLYRGDPDNDIAILKIPVTKPIRAAVFRETPIQVGEDVIVLGNPVGEGLSVTRGIVSRLNCSLDGKSISGSVKEVDVKGLIQIDAAVSPGNSGGPVIDTEGKVIGMVSMVDSEREGIAYAIPSSVLKKRYKELLAEKR